jgi:hypothetical protein
MDKSAKRRLIILGIVVAALLVLFVVSVVHGGGGPGGGCSAGQRAAWRTRLLRSGPVAPGQLGGCTTAPGRFAISVGCELKVAAADARSRQLVIEAVDPIELRLVTDADGRRIAMRVKLEPGQSKQIFVGKAGETLGLRCLTGITCRAGVR